MFYVLKIPLPTPSSLLNLIITLKIYLSATGEKNSKHAGYTNILRNRTGKQEITCQVQAKKEEDIEINFIEAKYDGVEWKELGQGS